jgi:hypothetical protein
MSRGQVGSPYLPGREAATPPDVAHCEGFRVQSPDGLVGVLGAVRSAPSTSSDRADELAVHAGRSSEMLLLIPVGEVLSVHVVERLVVLGPSPRIAATERMARPDGLDLGRRTYVDPIAGRGA